MNISYSQESNPLNGNNEKLNTINELRVQSKKKTEFESLTPAELVKKEQDLRKELFNLKMQKSTGQLEDNKSLGRVKRDIARTLTYLKMKSDSAKSSVPAERGK